MTTTSPYPVGSPAFARAYTVTMRPYLLFVSGVTGILGMTVAGPCLLYTSPSPRDKD